MTTFTGYEPKTGVPTALGPQGQQQQIVPQSAASSNQSVEDVNAQWYANMPYDPQSGSSLNQPGIGQPHAQTHRSPANVLQDAVSIPVAGASGQLVAADTDDLSHDLSNLMDQTLQSVEDFLEEDKETTKDAMVPSVGKTVGIGQPHAQPVVQVNSPGIGQPSAQTVDLDAYLKLESQVQGMRAELHSTIEQCENYAAHVKSDSRAKAKAALAHQTKAFEDKAAEFQRLARDVTESQVAQAKAHVIADAQSAIGDRDQMLAGASHLVAELEHHLSIAQGLADTEYRQKEELRLQAEAEIRAQQAAASRDQASLRTSLMQQADAAHAAAMEEKDQALKREAEAKHKAL